MDWGAACSSGRTYWIYWGFGSLNEIVQSSLLPGKSGNGVGLMTEHHPPHHVCWITPAELATFATSDGVVGFYNAMYYSSLLKAKGIRSAVADGETLPCPCGRTITSPMQIRDYLRCVWKQQSEDGRNFISRQTYVICTGCPKTLVGCMNDARLHAGHHVRTRYLPIKATGRPGSR